MEDKEVQTLKADIAEIKDAVKNVSAVVNDMRVLLAGNYVTKQDFEEYKKGTTTNHRWWAGFVIAVTGAFVAIANYLGKIY